MKNLIERRFVKPGEGQTIAQIFIKPMVLLFIFMGATNCIAQTLTVKPQKPVPGDTLYITYDPKGGKFEKDTLKTATAIVFEGLMQDNKKINLSKQGEVYVGKLVTDSTTQLVAFAFSSKKVWDTAPTYGHFYPFYKDGKTVEGAQYLMADFYINATGKTLYGFNEDYQKALQLVQEERSQYPAAKNSIMVVQKYYQLLLKLSPEKAKTEILGIIAAIDQQKKITDMDYLKQFRLYEVLGMTEQAGKTIEQLAITYPSSPVIFSKRYKDALTPQSAGQMEALAIKLINDYDMLHSKDFNSLLSSVYSAVNQAYLKEFNLPKFYFYVQKQSANVKLNNLFTAAQFLADSQKELDAAEKISKWGLALLDTTASQTTNEKELNRLKEKKIEFNGALGQIFYRQQRFDEAFMLLKNVLEENEGKLAQVNLYYALLLARQKDYELAKNLLETIIKKGETTTEVMDAYKVAYQNSSANKEDYEINLSKLLAEVAKNRTAALTKMMLNEPAPNFTLVDQKGKKVSLAAYKGKIVVLDFWATWCIPCLQAFPGMQKLVSKYEKDTNVVFLFINTAETFTKDLSKRITAYLKKNSYNFHVLLDEIGTTNGKKYVVQTQYGASAIPLKVVIDQKGTIRFKTVGYLGSDELVVKELSELITMLK
ncbi:redoxin domain-containing protein [Pedobacter sp. Hv1]|uniref:redoxin domain-containing protein n=1 Tax=Pedobacter sp. Hv1 TaxID=1740090 RepID=UPI0006D8D0DD|nr:redoxin domain-containing protein [Pedobacter sp. Hv1]KQC02536.1 hypothetical protein AQF98_02885 [Pedobacter sp. Hv1]